LFGEDDDDTFHSSGDSAVDTLSGGAGSNDDAIDRDKTSVLDLYSTIEILA
jgi:hypothetical protein